MHTYEIFVNGRKVRTTRSGKAAFKDFAFYKLGDWHNYALGEKIMSVHLNRDEGRIQEKGEDFGTLKGDAQ